MAKGLATSTSHLVLLGTSLLMLTYALNLQVSLLEHVRIPINKTLETLQNTSGLYAKHMHVSNPTPPSSPNIQLDLSGPFTQGDTTSFTLTIKNLGQGLVHIPQIEIDLKGPEGDIELEPLSDLTILYKSTHQISFKSPPGDYTINVTASNKTTIFATINHSFVIQESLPSPPKNLEGEITLSPKTMDIMLVDYNLTRHYFDVQIGDYYWVNLTEPTHDNYTYIYLEGNHTNDEFSDWLTGWANQTILVSGIPYHIHDQEKPLLKFTNLKIPINAKIDSISLLGSMSCDGRGNAVNISFEDEKIHLNFHDDICMSEDVQCGETDGFMYYKVFPGGYIRQFYLFPFTKSFSPTYVDYLVINATCPMYLASLTIHNTYKKSYNVSSAYLVLKNQSYVLIDDVFYTPVYIGGANTSFFDITDLYLSGKHTLAFQLPNPLIRPAYAVLTSFSGTNATIPKDVKPIKTYTNVNFKPAPYQKIVHEIKFDISATTEHSAWIARSWMQPLTYPGISYTQFRYSLDGPGIGDPSPYDFKWCLSILSHNLSDSPSQHTCNKIRRSYVSDFLTFPPTFTSENSMWIDYATYISYYRGIDLDHKSTMTTITFQGNVLLEHMQKQFKGHTSTTTYKIGPYLKDLYFLSRSKCGEDNECEFKFKVGNKNLRRTLDVWSAVSPTAWIVHNPPPSQHPSDSLEITTTITSDWRGASTTYDLYTVYGLPILARFDGQYIQGRGKQMLDDVPATFHFYGDGQIQINTTLTYLENNNISLLPDNFEKAILVLDPVEAAPSLNVTLNDQEIFYGDLSTPKKIDITSILVPLTQNQLVFVGDNGEIKWRILLS